MRIEPIIYDSSFYKKLDNDEFKINFSKSKEYFYCRLPKSVVFYEVGDKQYAKTDKDYKYYEITAKTKAEVRNKARKHIGKIIQEQSSGVVKEEELVAEMMRKWIYSQHNTMEDKSFTRLEEVFLRQVKPFLPRKRIEEITVEDINTILKSNMDKGYSFDTLKKIKNQLYSFFDFYYQNRRIDRNPLESKTLFKIDEAKVKNLQMKLRENQEALIDRVLNNTHLTISELKIISDFLKRTVDEKVLKTASEVSNSNFYITKEWLLNLKNKIKKAENINEEANIFSLRLCEKYSVKDVELIFTHLKFNEKDKIEIFSDEEIEKMKDVIENGYYLDCKSRTGTPYKSGPFYLTQPEYFLFMLYTGLRVGEAAALKYSDINFETNQITISKSRKTSKERDSEGNPTGKIKVYEGKPKTKSSNATIYVPQQAIDVLIKMKSKEAEDYSGYIANDNGKPLSDTALRKRFYCLLDRAGVKRKGTHTLRHTCATKVYQQTQDITIAQKLVRHAQASTTSDMYVNPQEEYVKNKIKEIKF
jgi:integrase